jgi:quercetin dioxygenase-like cupin family protein
LVARLVLVEFEDAGASIKSRHPGPVSEIEQSVSIEVARWTEAGEPDAAKLKQRLQSEGYSVFQWTDAPGTKYGPHAHAEDQSHWIVRGALELRVGHETYTLRGGDRDFLSANTIHSAFVPGDEPVVYLIGAKT